MNINPVDYPALDVEIFDYATNWQFNDGTGQPVADDVYVKCMYSNGFVANKVRVAKAWVTWSAGRNYWLRPEDDRLWIICYIVV
jgi:hypothetical protein